MLLEWKKSVWWQFLGCAAFLISRMVLEAQPPPPLDVIVVLDQSAAIRSFDPDRQILQSLAQFIRDLPDDASSGLVIFGSQAWSLYPLSKPGQESRQELLDLLPQVRFADPEANPAAGLERGLSELAKGRLESRKILLVLACTDESGGANQERVQHLPEQLLSSPKNSIMICGIGLGKASGGGWFQEMTMRTGGSFTQATEAAQLSSAFQSVLRLLQRVEPPPSPPPAPVAPPATPPAPAVPGEGAVPAHQPRARRAGDAAQR